MPYKWNCECLALYKVNRTLRTFLKNSVRLQKTSLEVNSPFTYIYLSIYFYLAFIIRNSYHTESSNSLAYGRGALEIEIMEDTYHP